MLHLPPSWNTKYCCQASCKPVSSPYCLALPHLLLLFPSLCCVGTGLSFYYTSVQSLLQGELYLWWGPCSGVLSAGVPETVMKDLKAISKLCGGKKDTCQKLEWGHSSLHCLSWPLLQNLERSCTLMCLPDLSEAACMPVPPLCSRPASKWPAPIQRWWCLRYYWCVLLRAQYHPKKKLQSLLFCRSAFKTQSKHVPQQCQLLTLENIPK